MGSDGPANVVLIAGPTGSGKSGLALRLAEALGGVVVNADSLQVYRALPILTAQPSAAEKARAPHRLYGVLGLSETCSAGRYAKLAASEIDQAQAAGQPVIIVGGTGLYLKALTEGLSPIPQTPPQLRARLREEWEAQGPEPLRAELKQADPVWSGQIAPGDTQRLLRGLEVFRATGRPLSDWQKEPREPVLRSPWRGLVLTPDKAWLEDRCAERFNQMLRAGVLEELRAFQELPGGDASAVTQALGYRPLSAHLRGAMSLDEAREETLKDTRRFAKRQMTWARTQILSWMTVNPQYLERNWQEFFAKFRNEG